MASRLTWFELAEFDDFLTASVVDSIYYWATIRKAYPQPNSFDSSKALTTREALKLIRKYLVFPLESGRRGTKLDSVCMSNLLQEFMRHDKVRDFLKRYPSEAKIVEFMSHAKRYFQLYSKECGFDICATDRYMSKSHKLEACVIAKKVYQKNEEVKFLYGCLAQLDEDEVNNLDQNDFSIINISSKSEPSLMLGPTRFVNHDCNGNARFSSTRAGMTIIANRKILIGEEITVPYATNYFGKDNKDCLCATCEQNGTGAYSVRVPLDLSNKQVLEVDEASESESDKDDIIVIDNFSDEPQSEDDVEDEEVEMEIDDDEDVGDKSAKLFYPTPESDNMHDSEQVFEIITDTEDESNEYEEFNDAKEYVCEGFEGSESVEAKFVDSKNSNTVQFSTANEKSSDLLPNNEQNLLAAESPADILFCPDQKEAGKKETGHVTDPSSPEESDMEIMEIQDIDVYEQGENKLYPKTKQTNTDCPAKKGSKYKKRQVSAAEYKRVLRPRHKVQSRKEEMSATTLDYFPIDRSPDTLKLDLKKHNLYNNKKINHYELLQRKIFRTFQKLYNKTVYDPQYQQNHTIYDCYNCGCYFEYIETVWKERDYGLKLPKLVQNTKRHVSDKSIENLYCPRCLRHYKVFKLAWPLTKFDISTASDIECMRQFLTFWPLKRDPIMPSESVETGLERSRLASRDVDENKAKFNYYDMKNYIVTNLGDDTRENSLVSKERLGDVDVIFSNISELKISLRSSALSGSSSGSVMPLRLFPIPFSIVEQLKKEWIRLYKVYVSKSEAFEEPGPDIPPTTKPSVKNNTSTYKNVPVKKLRSIKLNLKPTTAAAGCMKAKTRSSEAKFEVVKKQNSDKVIIKKRSNPGKVAIKKKQPTIVDFPKRRRGRPRGSGYKQKQALAKKKKAMKNGLNLSPKMFELLESHLNQTGPIESAKSILEDSTQLTKLKAKGTGAREKNSILSNEVKVKTESVSPYGSDAGSETDLEILEVVEKHTTEELINDEHLFSNDDNFEKITESQSLVINHLGSYTGEEGKSFEYFEID